jgi:hypothetical protein
MVKEDFKKLLKMIKKNDKIFLAGHNGLSWFCNFKN